MEEVFGNPKNLCRICFEVGDYEIKSYPELLSIFKQLNAFEYCYTKEVPTMICTICRNELINCYNFLIKLQNADEQIKQLFYMNCEKFSDGKINNIEIVVNEENASNFKNLINDKKPIKKLYNTDTEIKNNNKRPNIVVTDNVSNILSKTQKTSTCEMINNKISNKVNSELKLHVPSTSSSINTKKSKEISDDDCFVITNFVLTSEENLISNKDKNKSDINTKNNGAEISCLDKSISEVVSVEMVPVQVSVKSGVIDFKYKDLESNVENLNTIYKCKYCPRAFSTSDYLIKHARKAHCCRFCMKGFEKTNDLFEHIKTEHKEFKCSLCDKDLKTHSNLRAHLKRIHSIELPLHTTLLSVKRKN